MTRVTKIFLITFSLVAYAVLIYVSISTLPNPVELEHAYTIRNVGIWLSWKMKVMNYDSRYFTYLIQSLNPLVFNQISGYKYTILATIFLCFYSLFSFTCLLFRNSKWKETAFIGFVSSVFIFISTPSLLMSLYWGSVSHIYFWPCLILLLAVKSMYNFVNAENPKTTNYVSMAVLLFAGIGCNEMFLPIYFLIAFATPIYAYFFRRETLAKAIIVTLLILMYILFFMLLPATFSKSNLDSNFDFTQSFVFFLKDYLLHMFEYLFTVKTIFIFLFAFFLKDKIVQNMKLVYIAIFVITIVSFLAVLPFYMAGVDKIDIIRIYVPITFIQYICLLYFVFPWVWNWILGLNLFENRQFSIKKSVNYLIVFIVVLISIQSYNGDGSFGILIKELRHGEIKEYSEFLKNRYEVLENAGVEDGFKVVCLERITVSPKTLVWRGFVESEYSDEDNRRFRYAELLKNYFLVDEIFFIENEKD